MTTIPTVYERNQFLYGHEELTGKAAIMHFLPTARSRTWRRGFFVKSYGEHAWNTAMALVKAGEIHSFKFEEGL